MAESESKLNPVIAIEIGNKNSGYVYFSRNENHRILTATYRNGLPKDRVPTALLVNRDLTFDSFGNLAKDKYFNITFTKEQANYLYFEKCLQPSIDTSNLEQLADYYAEIMEYLYKKCLKCLNERKGKRTIQVEDLLFIFPVNAQTERLLNLAVDKAKLKKENVRLVLETDAAALYCADQNLLFDNDGKANMLTEGYKFAVLDLGGKKSQYCKYEVLGNDTYRRISEVVLEPFGGENVTENFIKKLESILDKTDWENFTTENENDYLNIRRSFEKLKLSFDSSKPDIIMEMPKAFITLVGDKTCNGISFEEDNKIIVQLGDLFDEPLREIVEKLKCHKDIDIILLVGGFSGSPYARDYITRKIESIPIVLVPTPDLAVLKGAVMMGHKKLYMSEYAYSFVEDTTDRHPESVKTTLQGEQCYKGVFKKVMHINEATCPFNIVQSEEINVMPFHEETKSCFEEVDSKDPTGKRQDEVTAQALVNVDKTVRCSTTEEEGQGFWEKTKEVMCWIFKKNLKENDQSSV